ncbi:hypothetical protein TIFTF001_007328 [Ficus carica]|uniref:C2 domain-containing protein n=1 Tax=Ficus carica TaxID=3494 RepID=A0AA87ZL19_FICCA|nr:hypothetical protein TIFTF001_007328 [Ficus carica]
MQYRQMEITIISAKGLKRVKHLSKMDVYVLVSLSGGPQIEQKTPVDKGSGPNPNWNFPMNFNIDEEEAKRDRLTLNFKVVCHRRIHSDKDIGEANVPVKELLDNGGDGKYVKYVTFQLKKPNGKHRGELNLSYKFANQVLETSSTVKVMPAYPPPGYPVTGQGGGEHYQTVPPMGLAASGDYIPTVVRPQSADDTEVNAAFLSGVLEGLLLGQELANGGVVDENISFDFNGVFTTSADAGQEVGGGGGGGTTTACDAGHGVAGAGAGGGVN